VSLRQAPPSARRPGRRRFGRGTGLDGRGSRLPRALVGRSNRRVLDGAERLPLAAYLIATAFFLVYASYSWSRHEQYLTAGYDLGIFDQALRHYAHFHAPIVSLKGDGFDILGDHFHPILVMLVPLYWIWTDPRMLLLAQAALVAASVLPVFRFTQRHLGQRVAAVVAVAYALCWPLQLMIDFDFHEIAFAVPLIALVVDGLDRRAYRVVVVSSVLLLFVREDMGMFVVAVAILVAFRREWLLAGLLFVLGVAGYVVATDVVIPALSPTGSFAYWSYGSLGPNLPSALWGALRDPWLVAKTFFTPVEKTRTLWWLLAVPAFGCIASPYALLALPFVAERFLSSREHLWRTQFHYSAVVAPIAVMAGVAGLAKLRRARWLRDAALLAMVAIPIAGMYVEPTMFPFVRMVNGAAWGFTPHMAAIADGTKMVPPHVCVEADDRLLPHLVGRDYLSPVGAADSSYGKANWVFLDLSQHETGYLGPTPQAAMANAVRQGFHVVYNRDNVVLLRRDAPTATKCQGPLT
jgi:uncharacterized membrane protein